MKKLHKATVAIVVLILMIATATTAFAATTIFNYRSDSFWFENNQGKFKPTFNSSGARAVVGAIRKNGTVDGTITVKVYRKDILGVKHQVLSYTATADGKAHTSPSFEIKKNNDYLVDIMVSTKYESVVAVTIAA